MQKEKTEHIKLLLDIGDLNWVFKDSSDIPALLQNIVKMVAKHMHADVCSVYFFDDKKNELVLRANTGLNPDSIGRIRMKLGEGIAGTSLERLEPISTKDGFAHPSFKFFKGTNEELYKSFLAVPVVSGNLKVGVLVLQRKEENNFSENDILALRVIASQLANLIQNVKLMTSVKEGQKRAADNTVKPVFKKEMLRGKPASRGYAYAPIAVIEENKGFTELESLKFKAYTLKDFAEALKETEIQIETLQNHVKKDLSDAASMIFTSHLLILKDRSFIEAISDSIKGGKNPPEAVMAVSKKYVNTFLNSSNEYLREKSKDIEDLAIRVISNIVKKEIKLTGVKGRIVLAREMYPSDILRFSSEQIRGALLISGGVTSHVSILARSLGIPMVIVNEPSLLNIDKEARLLMDAELGNIFVNPPKELLVEYKDKLESANKRVSVKLLPQTKTKDGLRIQLMANVNLLKDLDVLRELSPDGIGLYRSEFPFLVRSNFPSEEEQYFVYRKLVEGMPGKEITFRTLDIGGDKILSYSTGPKKDNPFLGLRSIRFSLKNRDVFKDQLRAILRAGHDANLRIMFPMIFSVEEFASAKEVVKECSEVLRKQGIAHNSSPKIGMMVEIPAVIGIIEDFTKYADFFSIGTNDLVQYMLAVDRNNEEVAEYYLPHHPAVLKAIKKVAAAGIAGNIDVSVCGDMSNSPKYIAFLIGAGIRKLSMNPGYLFENQKVIASLDSKDAQKIADEALKLSKISDIEKLILS